MLNYLFLILNLIICLKYIYKKDYAILAYIILYQEIHLIPFNNLGYQSIGYVYYIFIAVLFLLSATSLEISKKRIRYLLSNNIIRAIILITTLLLIHTFGIGLYSKNAEIFVFRYFVQMLPVFIYLILVLEGAKNEKFINQFIKGILLYGFLLALILLATTDAINIASYKRGDIRQVLGISPIAITIIGGDLFITSFLLFLDSKYKKYINILYIFMFISVALIIAGTSRGPLLSLLATLSFYIIFRRKTNLFHIFSKNSVKIVITIFIIIIFLSMYNIGSLEIVEVYLKRINKLDNYENMWRYKRYILAYNFFNNNVSVFSRIFFIGTGPAGFDLKLGYQYAHNFILEIVFEYGFAGVIFLFLFIPTIFKYSYRFLKENIPEKFLIVPLLVIYRFGTTMFSGDLIAWRNLFFYSIILVHIYMLGKRKKII